ncbi:14340_t:CDS:2 [Acaulospora morrowiae]|uniref:14340_t:CDS:1 n=1 Tax=Acaulospora morrowiae TaxID=94023 RepID=A0A9N9DM85_9GLOM|nr:14340_t:CDS:2 [Acaulospora morrowiae]
MTIKQKEVDKDLKETMIGHPSEILEECPNENKAQAAKYDQRDNVIKFTYDEVQMTESTRMLDKRNDEVSARHREEASSREGDKLTGRCIDKQQVEESLDEKMCPEPQREVDHVKKVGEAVQGIEAMIRNQELICNKISVAHDSPNSCKKMIITDDRAIVPKVISGQIKVGDEPEKENKLVMSHRRNKELFKQFLEMDSAVASYETMYDVEIVEEVLHCSNPLPPENNSEDKVTPLPMTAMQGKKMLEGALLWCDSRTKWKLM